VLVKNGRVVLATGSAEHVLGPVSELTFGRNAVPTDTDTLLAIVATAWALDIAPDLIGAGIKTFEPEALPVTPPVVPATGLAANAGGVR
jgi:cyanophycin synthetase